MKRLKAIGTILLIAAVLAPSPASAYSACANKVSGVTRLLLKGGKCKKNEIPIDLGGGALQVLDVNNKVIGEAMLLNSSNQDFVMRLIDGIWMTLPVGTGGFIGFGCGFREYFKSNDCSGPPYFIVPRYSDLQVSPPSFRLHEGTQTNDMCVFDLVVYYASSPPEVVTFHSSGSLDGDPANPPVDCLAKDLTETAGVIKTFDLGTLGFVPPFHLQ